MGLRIFIGFIVLAVVQMMFYYPQLPEQIAAHFNASGEPDAWTRKSVFFAVNAFIVGLTLVFFAWLPQKLFGQTPDPASTSARRYSPATRRFLETRLIWLGVLNLILMILVSQLVYSTNLTPTPRLGSSMSAILAAYMLGVMIWVAGLIRARKQQ